MTRKLSITPASEVPNIEIGKGRTINVGKCRDYGESLLVEAQSETFNLQANRRALGLARNFVTNGYSVCLVGPASAVHVIAQTTPGFVGEYSTLGNITDPERRNPVQGPNAPRLIDTHDVFVVFEPDFVAPTLLRELTTLATDGEAVVIVESDRESRYHSAYEELRRRPDRFVVDLGQSDIA